METNPVSDTPVTFEMVDTNGDKAVTAEELRSAEKAHPSLYVDPNLMTSLFESMSLDEFIKLAPPGLVDQNAAELFKLLRELAEVEKDIDKALKDVTRSLIEFFVEESKAAAKKEMTGAIVALTINMAAAAATMVVACAGVRCIRSANSPKMTEMQKSMAMQMAQMWSMVGGQAAGIVGSFSQPVSQIYSALAALIRATADEAKENANLTEAEQGEASEARKNIAQTLMDLIKQMADADTRAATA